jgi:uncharacterized membrane protein YedE/YeeE
MSAVRAGLSALVSGGLFGTGLVISGMTRPEKVLAFLDVLGNWDPSLLLVMVGAIGVHAVLSRLLSRPTASTVDAGCSIPSPRRVDARLVAGAAVFGVGWGLSGYCPGPSVVALASGAASSASFFVALLAGALLASALEGRNVVVPRAAHEPTIEGWARD